MRKTWLFVNLFTGFSPYYLRGHGFRFKSWPFVELLYSTQDKWSKSTSLKAVVSLDAGSTKVCKVIPFQQLVHSGIYDVICVCATSLSDSIMDSELVSGYCIFCKDRVDVLELVSWLFQSRT